MFTASELMTPHPATVRANDRVSDAVQILQSLEIRHVPVVNAQQELIGMLSDRDIRSLAVPVIIDASWLGTAQSALDAPVSSLMTGAPIAVSLEADVGEIVDIMLDNNIGAVPVTDGDGRLVGIVSYVDVLRNVELADREVEAP